MRAWIGAAVAAALLAASALAQEVRSPAVTAAMAPLVAARDKARAAEAALPPIDQVPLKEALERMGRLDQAVRLEIGDVPFQTLGCADRRQVLAEIAALTVPVDDANHARIVKLLPAQGWFNVAEVGEDAAEAAFHIINHGDTASQKRVLPHLQALAARGQADARDVAAMTDKIAVAEGRPQVYGTQFSFVDGVEAPHPLADPANVEQRRRDLGMTRTYAQEMAGFAARQARAGPVRPDLACAP